MPDIQEIIDSYPEHTEMLEAYNQYDTEPIQSVELTFLQGETIPNSLIITNSSGDKMIIGNEDAITEIVAMEIEAGKAWGIDSDILAEITRIDSEVFDALKEKFSEEAGPYIVQIIESSFTASVNKIAQRMFDKDYCEDWFNPEYGVEILEAEYYLYPFNQYSQ